MKNMALLGLQGENKPSEKEHFVILVEVTPTYVRYNPTLHDQPIRIDIVLDGEGEATIAISNNHQSTTDIYISENGHIFYRLRKGQITRTKTTVRGRTVKTVYVLVPGTGKWILDIYLE